ncbi:nucleoid-associated protein [Shewanella sp. WE21]|uniref:nucleoid-associated protein n=1 Tax=Shewanella sp. WE21 TaxID=2029986 RepID=UPI000CF65E0E|nr:nucleoid-associated protein [Shewanella sp. WE21]AVI66514.1 nucleoid-associated protein [Shewanella sp. WE21]
MPVIKRFVIHELFKEKEPDIAKVLLNLSVEIIKNLALDLVKIKDGKTAVLWGKFKGNGDFPAKLIELKNQVPESGKDAKFKELTKLAMKSLYGEIVHTNSKGGYICFIEYESYKSSRFMAAMITNTSGIKLKKLKPTSDIHVDLSKLHQAVDINISAFLDALEKPEAGVDVLEKNYLSFIGKGKYTDYFTKAFDCVNGTTPARAVVKSVILLKDFLVEHNADSVAQKEARSQWVRYLSENSNEEVYLTKLEEIAISHLPSICSDEDKDSFILFSKQDKYEMPASFLARKESVEKLARIYYTTDSFNFNFDFENIGLLGCASDTNKPILFDPNSNDIIIKGRMITPMVKDAINQALDLKEDEVDDE